MRLGILALFVLALPAKAEAGGVLELVPGQAGPYSPGQAVSVDVWLHNGESFGVDLRLVALDVQGLRQRLFAGGDFQTSGGVTVNHVAKFTGGSWTAIDQGLGGPVYALQPCALNSGTTLYVGGKVWGVSDWEATVNRLEAGWWTEIGRSPEGSVRSLFCWDNGASGNRLVAGGYIWTMDGTEAYGIAQWDGSDWTPLQNLDSGVRDMVVFDDGTGPALYAVGTFPSTMPPAPIALRRVGKWTGTTWAPLGGGVMDGYREWAVNALAVFNDGTGPALYAAGDFRDIYLPATNGLMQVNNIAKWDGTAWSAVGDGTTPNTAAPIFDLMVFDDGTGPALYAEGISPRLAESRSTTLLDGMARRGRMSAAESLATRTPRSMHLPCSMMVRDRRSTPEVGSRMLGASPYRTLPSGTERIGRPLARVSMTRFVPLRFMKPTAIPTWSSRGTSSLISAPCPMAARSMLCFLSFPARC